jgi:hypothetical protein
MGAVKYLIVAPDSSQQPEIAGLLLDQAVRWATSAGVEFLVGKPYTDDVVVVHALEKEGFLLVDTLLDYVYDARKYPLHSVPAPPMSLDIPLRLAREADIEELKAVARAAFRNHFGRFHSDERISKDQALRVYEAWVESSCRGYADWVVVAEIEGRIAGYSIWKKPSLSDQELSIQVGHYSIAATHPDYAGRGLFTLLTYRGMELLDGMADCIEGPTHINNYPVQRGYAKLLWRICDARHSFHKWLT